MRDLDVRAAVRKSLNAAHPEPQTVIVEEMGIWSSAVRVDLAVINGEMHGYELKSERDTLARLPNQAEIYNYVFDRVSLVVAARHYEKAVAIIPYWWGVDVASSGDCEVCLASARLAQPNPSVSKLHVARLLWRSDLIDLLTIHRASKGFLSANAENLAKRAADVVELNVLQAFVRDRLSMRFRELRQMPQRNSEMPVRTDFNPL